MGKNDLLIEPYYVSIKYIQAKNWEKIIKSKNQFVKLPDAIDILNWLLGIKIYKSSFEIFIF